MSAAVHHHRHLAFTADNGASRVGEGRAFTRQALADWHLAPSAIGDDAELVVSELVANAVQHTVGPLAMDLEDDGSRLRITVTDPRSDITLPDASSHRPGWIGGHGLFIVDRLTLHWGAFPEGSSKSIWADLLLAPAQPTRSPRDQGRHDDGEAGARVPRFDRPSADTTAMGARGLKQEGRRAQQRRDLR